MQKPKGSLVPQYFFWLIKTVSEVILIRSIESYIFSNSLFRSCIRIPSLPTYFDVSYTRLNESSSKIFHFDEIVSCTSLNGGFILLESLKTAYLHAQWQTDGDLGRLEYDFSISKAKDLWIGRLHHRSLFHCFLFCHFELASLRIHRDA